MKRGRRNILGAFGLSPCSPYCKRTDWLSNPKARNAFRTGYKNIFQSWRSCSRLFCGSGTTLVAARNLRRKFIGADINAGRSKQLLSAFLVKSTSTALIFLVKIICTLRASKFTRLIRYEVFRNPIQAKELLIEALEVQKLEFSTVFDGEKDGRMVKIMPVNRIATRADLSELIAGFDYKAWERKAKADPSGREDHPRLYGPRAGLGRAIGAGRQAFQDRHRGGGHPAR